LLSCHDRIVVINLCPDQGSKKNNQVEQRTAISIHGFLYETVGRFLQRKLRNTNTGTPNNNKKYFRFSTKC